MARKLAFTDLDEDKQNFAHIYSAFAIGERSLAGAKAMRCALRIWDALDGIAKTVVRTDGEAKALQDGGGEILLEEAEYEALKKSVGDVLYNGLNAMTAQTQLSYRIVDARTACRIMDFIESAEEVKLEKEKKSSSE